MKKKLLFFGVFVFLLNLLPHASAQLVFTTNITTAGIYPQSLAAADFNSDGKMDLVSADPFLTGLLVLTNTGSGGFATNQVVGGVGISPVCVITADVNTDGKPDLVSVDGTDGQLTVLTNNGSGGFAVSFSNVLGGFTVFSAAVADMNNDGRLDLIASGSKSLIFTNAGNGSFGSNATVNVPFGSAAVRAADVNNDSRVDLIFANTSANSVVVMTNNGAGFGISATLFTGGTIAYKDNFAVVDVNRDGKPDLIVGNTAFGGAISVFTNNGAGGFGTNAPANLPPNFRSYVLVTSDLNFDGAPDLMAIGNAFPGFGNWVTVFTNNGAGAFGYNTQVGAGGDIFARAVVDINNDGHPELIAISADDASMTTYTVVMAPSSPTGFEPHTFAIASGSPYGMTSADVNNDGKPDVITADSNGTNTMTVFTNDGSGNLVISAILPVGNQPFSVAAVDVNGDGKLDLVSANFAGSSLTIYTNRGNSFGSNTTVNVSGQPYFVLGADFNLDGKMDLACANWIGQTMTVLYNNGNGTFSTTTMNTGITPRGLVAADINNDGKVDLLSANGSSSTVSIYTNRVTGFTTNTAVKVGLGPFGITAADFNNDGKVDVATANFADSTVTILTNNGSGILSSNATLTVDMDPACIVAADLNTDGKVDLIVANHNGNTLMVFTNNGSGGFGFNTRIYLFNAGPTGLAAADMNQDGKQDLISGNQNGTVTVLLQKVAPPPKLNIAVAGANSVLVSWSSISTSFQLQTNATLTGTWAAFGGPVTVTGGTNQSATMTAPGNKLFLRLKL